MQQPPSFKFPPRFDRGEKIGEGTYGWVFHSRNKETGKNYALKRLKEGREGEGINPTAIREVTLLRELGHDNIVKLDSVHINRAEPSLWLAFDYADHDLFEMIRFHSQYRDNRRDNPTGLMPHHVVKSVMWQLLNGLNYLHQNWIIHRDMKPSNVLVMGEDAGPEQFGRVKLGDFGLARIFQAPCKPLSDNGVVVTIWYRSPELLLGAKHHTRAVDVWAAGCIFAELCMLRPLFQGTERKTPGNAFQQDQLDRIFGVLGHPNTRQWPDLEHLHHWHDNTDNVRVKRDSYPSHSLLGQALTDGMKQSLPAWCAGQIPAECLMPPEALKLLARMLDYDPNTRITADEALQHPFFTATEPRPCANAFAMPNSSEPTVRYVRRVISNQFPQEPGQAQQQQAVPGRARDGSALQPGMRSASVHAPRKRKAEQQAAPVGFR